LSGYIFMVEFDIFFNIVFILLRFKKDVLLFNLQ
jgi:hypothetical protein